MKVITYLNECFENEVRTKYRKGKINIRTLKKKRANIKSDFLWPLKIN